ncbi:unnamed protein product [Closterium sp. NIES-53]
MASWKSTGTYVDAVPPPRTNIVDGMWIFRVKQPPGFPPVFKVQYVALGFSQRQRVEFFQTFSPTLKMTTLRVLLHIAAQRDYELHSLDFPTAFLQGSLHEEIWLRRPPGFTGTTLAAHNFAPSTTDPSLFLRTNRSLPSFYILLYVDDLVFAIADSEALALVKAELQKRRTCTDLAPPLDESVEPSGPYLELVGCLMYLMTFTLPDLAYPLSILACYVAPERHRPKHYRAATMLRGRDLRCGYGCTEVTLADLLVDRLGMKHIALCYFLTRELQQRGRLCLAYVASQANTADIFTKALGSGDHQHFCTALRHVPTLPHLLVS